MTRPGFTEGPLLGVNPLLSEIVPRVLPIGWIQDRGGFIGEDGFINGTFYENGLLGLRVGLSIATEQDGRDWVHLSCSHRMRIPTWPELVEAKEIFIGKDRKAIQILPARAEWVNINPRVLHLFHCIDGDTLPDFTRGSGSL